MSTRRNFLKQSSLMAAGIMAGNAEWFRASTPIGVQLYTLRNDIGKDPKGTLAKVAQIGYKRVETFGYANRKWFGLSASELAEELKKNGLTSPSGHTFPGGFFLKDGWEDTWKTAVEDSKAIGQEFIVVPWVEPELRSKADNFKKIADALNKAAGICKDASMKLAYHNHDFEFATVEGQRGFDILTKNTDPKAVHFEIDLYWAIKAGQDPIALFKQFPGRFAMWHVKDMDNTDKKFFTEVGNGTIDFKKIFEHAKESGMKYFFVEQDVCPGSPFDSIAKSYTYIDKNLIK